MKVVDENEEVQAVTNPMLPEMKTLSPLDLGYHLIEGLPSGMKLYPEGTEIYGRPLKVLEVKQLASINESNADNIINSIIRRAIKGIDADKILVADKLYILLWLRGTTFPDPSYGINFKCSVCGKESKYSFTLDKIETRQIDESFTMDKLAFKLPNNDVINFAFPTIAEEKQAEQFKANHSHLSELDSDIVSQCVLIKKINGEDKTMMEKYAYLAQMNPNDYVYFLSYIEKWSFGIKWVINVPCSLCGGTTLMGATFLGDGSFWLPRVDFS